MMGNLIVMTWMLLLGFVPNSSLKTSNKSIEASNYLTQTLGFGFHLADFIHIYSAVELRETKSKEIYFDPFRGDYLIGGSVYFKNFSLGISHECNHDIVTNMNFHEYNGWEAAFEKVYINYVLPIHIRSGITITPSITLTDQFTEKVRVKSNDKKNYFSHTPMDISPNIFSPELRLEMKLFHLRSHVAFQAGYTTHNNALAYSQVNLGAEVFYKNISLGLNYLNRKNMQKTAGYALDELTLFIRFRGRSSLL
jgi:hypothetical protein